MFDMIAGGIVGLCRGRLLQPDSNHEDLMRQRDDLSHIPRVPSALPLLVP